MPDEKAKAGNMAQQSHFLTSHKISSATHTILWSARIVRSVQPWGECSLEVQQTLGRAAIQICAPRL